MPPHTDFDAVLVGGGLANAVIALGLLAGGNRRIALVEAGDRIGGNHTWSFHSGDVPDRARAFIEPLIEYRWPAYSVAFPDYRREIRNEYASFTSARLHRVCESAFALSPGSQLLLGTHVSEIDATQVALQDGRTLSATLVVDARGPERLKPDTGCRYQKFLGLELSLSAAAPIRYPILMDARVSQAEGFRFVYVLPFDERRVLIEDTYFSDTSELDTAELEKRILDYASGHGFRVRGIERRERGTLPLPTRPPRAQPFEGPLLAGYAGGWFHPTTGYSFPAAVRLAACLAVSGPADAFGVELQRLFSRRQADQRYFCFLNRLLYRGFAPEQRYRVLERFYRLPADTIGRFYAMQTTTGDRARILCGRPPRGLSLSHALSTPE